MESLLEKSYDKNRGTDEFLILKKNMINFVESCIEMPMIDMRIT